MSYIGQELRQGKAVRTLFTASGGETAVTVAYTPGQLSVFLNGVKLIEAVDYVATTGTSITGLSPALTVDDTIDCVAIDALTSNDTVPTQAGNSGKFLTTNATTTSWATVDALPTQSGQSGKYLTTDATNSSWATVTTGVTGITSAANATAITIDSSEDCNFAGHLMPVVDNSKDLGSATKRWQNIYTTDLHLQNERGNWTVIEEENYLTLRNNKTNKIYKLVMEEIK